jgi:hypothetical protein
MAEVGAAHFALLATLSLPLAISLGTLRDSVHLHEVLGGVGLSEDGRSSRTME